MSSQFLDNSLKENSFLFGWREWVALPSLSIARIKAKIDTGARTSTLHAFSLEQFSQKGAPWVRFGLHPKQYNTAHEQYCEVPVIDIRQVTDSGGHREKRLVIGSDILLGGYTWPIEITLTDRDIMRFRMLLGRTAIPTGSLVDPKRSYVQGKRPSQHPNK